MGKKLKKKEVDAELVQAIFAAEKEWKQLRSIIERSIEPSPGGLYQEDVALAKYRFLLREARRRNVSAIR